MQDLPMSRKEENGSREALATSKLCSNITSEPAARQWERRMLAQGCEEDTSGKGWKYGYTFSI